LPLEVVLSLVKYTVQSKGEINGNNR